VVPEPGLDDAELRSALQREWYHTIELAPGVVTPGWIDARRLAPALPMPARLDGLRCLDVGTFDGFWAFEMERRGAAEVIAIDVLDPLAWDWPAGSDDAVVAALARRQEGGAGFEIARRALGSLVKRTELSVYELDPDRIGQFDFVYLGSLLIHLRDPILALERVRSICSGTLLVVDNIDLALTLFKPRRPLAALEGRGRPWWWKLNLAGLVRVVESAGFRLLRAPERIWMPTGTGHPRPRPSRALLHSEEARQLLLASVKGDPHGCVLAVPDA
jgi:tRNA (mo5U34)-methyltransferase